MAKTIMIQGTTSGAGKSVLTAGLCRVLYQDGYQVAPFKSQNMALNSFITRDGLEIGRAQAMQAEAAGIEPSVYMNPVLLKPTTDVGSQVIVNGEVRGNMTARQYHAFKRQLVPEIMAAFVALSRQADVIVIEGAGSPAEINLKQHDIVNMGLAKMLAAPVLIAADIDRGGVFASLYGTVALLDDDERALVKGTIINKFRGDPEILRPGLLTLERLTQVPVMGVVPMLPIDLDDEDSVSERFGEGNASGLVDIAVIRLPRISNFTDFGRLQATDLIRLHYVENTRQMGRPDLIIVPGTKSTMSDLLWMRQNGLEAQIKKLAASGTGVVGICGGYQMLGRTLSDPDGVESGGTLRGMELLMVDTVFSRDKARTRVKGRTRQLSGVLAPLSGRTFEGYEIHMGQTPSSAPFAIMEGGQSEGAQAGNVYGSYVHGLFDDADMIEGLQNALLIAKGLSPESAELLDAKAYKTAQYDRLAEGIRKSLDMERIYALIEKGV